MELKSGEVVSSLNLHHLPVEVTDIILDYCRVEDILNLAQTSKYWNDFVNKSRRFRNKVQLKITKSNCGDVMNCSREYVIVKILDHQSFDQQALKVILQKLAPKIQSLNIPARNLVSVHFPELRDLTIHSV